MSALLPIIDGLRAIFGTTTALPGLAPGLVVADEADWRPAADLGGPLLEVLLGSAARRWQAKPPAAAALAWKAYTHWVCLPAVLGWLTARRVPALTGANLLVQLDWPLGLLAVGLRADTPIFVLPGDPLAGSADRAVIVVRDEGELLTAFRRSLLDEHLLPLTLAIGRRARLSPRTLLGSVAATVAADVLRFPGAGPAGKPAQIQSLLAALGLGGLLDLSVDDDGHCSVRRRTCCLAFTLPRPRLCRDCVLQPAPPAG